MAVNINLVQQKKTPGIWRWIVILAGILFLLIAILLFESYETKSNLQANEEELQKIRGQVIVKTEIMNERQGTHTQELVHAVSWLEKERVNITAFLFELTALLPQRGYITSLQLSNKNQVELIVQFDRQREAAYFLHALKQVEWTKEASIKTLNEQQNSNGESARYEASYSFAFDSSYFSIIEEAKR